eukprot:3241468-Pyramimonas_sp.AAC.1
MGVILQQRERLNAIFRGLGQEATAVEGVLLDADASLGGAVGRRPHAQHPPSHGNHDKLSRSERHYTYP